MKENARSIALAALNRCFENGAWASQFLDSRISDLDPRDAALASRLTMGVLQNYCLLDNCIDQFRKKNGKLDLPVRNILRMGIYQLLFSDRIPASAAVNESVELCRRTGFSSACGMVNAILRKVSSTSFPLPDSLSVRYSQPQWFVDRMIAQHGLKFTEELLAANNKEPSIELHTAFKEGETYVQDLAAYQAVQMAEPKPGMMVLDACAAPGGKTFSAAVCMQNSGRIVSCDIHEKKLSLIERGAERLGISIVETRCLDGRSFVPEFENCFDLVIADVPCSGFGVMRKKPEVRFKKEADIAGMPAIQKNIVDNVSRYVKPGGKLLYSTCTIFPEENELISHAIKGFSIEQEKTFYPNVDDTDGFYACVLRKET